MLFIILMSLTGCLTIDDTLNPDGDVVLWPYDCDNNDSKILDAERTWSYLDRDGDGFGDPSNAVNGCEPPASYVSDAGDCDDNNAMIHPSMPELCGDGIDQDCDDKLDDEDSYLDEDSTKEFYADQDGDGFGDPNKTSQRCESSAEWLSDNTDCDDDDADVNPNAIEECDEQDNNCNGQIDEDTIDKKLRYNDLDRDDFGDPDSPTFVCPGYEGDTTSKFRATDCDDANADIHPDAVEVCDGIDNNCDWSTDTDAVDRNQYYNDSDRDGFGEADNLVYSCDPEPETRMSDNPDDCDDDDPWTFPGAPEICGDAVVNDCDARAAAADGGVADARTECPIGADSLANAMIKFVGESSGATAGKSIAGVGDLNGDGRNELLIGATGYGTPDTGAAYLVYGSTTLGGQVNLSTADYVFLGEDDGDDAGYAVTTIGDWDGDKRPELLIGSRGSDANGSYSGAAYLLLSDSLLSPGEISLHRAGVKFLGVDLMDMAGSAVADAGDINGDSVSDILIGAYGAAVGGDLSGAAYLIFGDAGLSGDYQLEDADAVLSGQDEYDYAGAEVSAAGDFDGDNDNDILVSAPTSGNWRGAVHLFLGPTIVGGSLDDADLIWQGEANYDYAGSSVRGDIDLDGDGKSEIIVGAPDSKRSFSNSGTVYIIRGDKKSTFASPSNLSSSDLIIEGHESSAYSGSSVANAGDLNGDSIPDIIVGAPLASVGGASYIFVSPHTLSGVISLADADVILSGEATNDDAGTFVTGIGDFDGDGLDDIGIGATGDDTMGTDAGAVYVLSGASLFDY